MTQQRGALFHNGVDAGNLVEKAVNPHDHARHLPLAIFEQTIVVEHGGQVVHPLHKPDFVQFFIGDLKHLARDRGDFQVGIESAEQGANKSMQAVEDAHHNEERHGACKHAHHRYHGDDVDDVLRFFRK